jgi:hypothetical protein
LDDEVSPVDDVSRYVWRRSMPAKPLDRSTLAEAVKAFLAVIETTPGSPPPAAEIEPAPAPSRGHPRRSRALEPAPPGPRLHTFKSLRETYQIPRATAYTLIARGKLIRIKIGRRALITDESARALLNAKA